MRKSRLVRAAILTVIVPMNVSAALYWDLNGSTAGAGTTPTGTWDAATANWNATADGTGVPGTWTSGQTAFFSAGSDATGAFTVTLSGTQTTTGITIEEGGVTFAAGTAAVGTGTLTILSGASLSIDSSARISGSKVTLDGGTLLSTNPSNGLSFIPTATLLEIGPNGGTVGYNSSGAGTSSIYSGTITGTGILTKSSVNEFRYQGAGTANSTFTKLVVTQGLFRLGNVTGNNFETGFGAAPASFTADAITLSGGGTIGTSYTVTLHANRGITLGTGGGGINATSGSMTVPGAISGNGGFIVVGGTVTLNGVNTFTGGITISAGTTTVGNTGGLVAQAIAATGNLTVNGNITGSDAITKTGAGILTLAGINSFSGGVTFNDGRINFNSNSAAGSGTIVVGAGADEFTNSAPAVVLANAITLGAGANPKIYSTSGNSLDITGVISGTGSLLRDDTGAGTLTFSGANTYNGGFKITSRGVSIGNKAGFGTGTLTIGDAVTAPANAISITATTDLSGANAVANAITLNRDFTTAGSNLELSAAIDLGAATRTITANNTAGSKTILSGIVSGVGGALTKAGTGTLELSGTTSFTGPTTIGAGTLLVSGNVNGTSQVAVSATLGGTGTIAPASGGNINVLAGGILSPGASIGTLTATLSGGGKLDISARVAAINSQSLVFELGPPAASDKFSISGGTIDIGSGVLEFDDFNFVPQAGFSDGFDYVLFDGTVPVTGTLGASLTGAIGAFSGQIMFADGGNDIVVHVVPEPNAALALLGGTAVILGIRRRRS
jgi:fibronectin-binding autotransporter adhesin